VAVRRAIPPTEKQDPSQRLKAAQKEGIEVQSTDMPPRFGSKRETPAQLWCTKKAELDPPLSQGLKYQSLQVSLPELGQQGLLFRNGDKVPPQGFEAIVATKQPALAEVGATEIAIGLDQPRKISVRRQGLDSAFTCV
jgi:hypothetical protein